jgi:hypothetical protein
VRPSYARPVSGILSKERTVAPPGYNRWLVPPAALAIHLSIGQAYAFSVFNLPLARTLGVTAPAPGDWKLTTIGWAFTIATAMLGGAFLFRVPGPDAVLPVPRAPAIAKPAGLISAANVDAAQAIKTPQFYLLWAVLFLNVTAGIGVLSQASAMIQEVFKGAVTPAAAAGFVGLLSLFNMGGRFLWASLSDRIGRRPTYAIFFSLGPLLYAAVPFAGRLGSVPLFVGCVAAIMTMYGGGFATIPAYLADMFGTASVGAIHGRLLTAWSAAGVAGPVLVNYIRQYQIEHGAQAAGAYNVTLYVMAGLLVVGFFCNAAVRAVDARHHMSEGELGAG